MNKNALAVSSIVICAGMLFADVSADITAAASDTVKIGELVKNLGTQQTLPAFASDVIKAISTMPVSPSRKVKQMAGASSEFLAVSGQEDTSKLLAVLTATVPYNFLPEWTRIFRGKVSEVTKSIGDEQYIKLVADVMKEIDSIAKSVPNDDKTVIVAFAIQLLARGKTYEEKNAWLETVKGSISADCAESVLAVMSAVFQGNYTTVLGPNAEIVSHVDATIIEPNNEKLVVPNVDTQIGPDGLQVSDTVSGVNQPTPIMSMSGDGAGVTKPPVPPVYAGQR